MEFKTVEDRIKHFKDLYKNGEISLKELKKKLDSDYLEINWEKNQNNCRKFLNNL